MLRICALLVVALPMRALAELALPSAKQLEFQTKHGKGCFFHVSACSLQQLCPATVYLGPCRWHATSPPQYLTASCFINGRHGLSRPLPLACYLTASVPHCILLHQWHAARRPSGQFGINTFTGQEHGTGDDKQPPSKFNPPVDLDTDQWVESCVAMGGSYAVFTAKHEEGMMNWPSKSTNYSIESSPFCRARKQAGRSCDLVGEFLASCDKYNITRGLYYTIANSHCRTVPSGGAPGNVSCDDMLRNAFTELATDYGPIGQFWFDHGNELFVDLVDKYQPGAHSDMQKRFFSNSLTFNSRFNMIIYQDRLGTNEGKALQKKTADFRRCVHRWERVDTCRDRGCEERLLHPLYIFYKTVDLPRQAWTNLGQVRERRRCAQVATSWTAPTPSGRRPTRW